MNSAAKVWVEKEFAAVSFGDARLDSRFRTILSDLTRHGGKTLAGSFEALSKLKASYRFMANVRVTLRAMLQPHVLHTLERMRGHSTVLVLQDTTYLNFGHRADAVGLDVVNRSGSNKAVEGLMLHNTLAVTTDGLPLGLLDQRFIDRKSFHESSAEQTRAHRSRLGKAIGDKESRRWIDVIHRCHALDAGDCEMVHVCDREADIYELFRDAEALGEKVLVRAEHDRAIDKAHQHEDPTAWIFDKLQARRAQGRTSVTLQVNERGKKYREATLSIVHVPISMPAPTNRTVAKDGPSLPMVALTAIMAIEKQSSRPLCERVCWVLLTNLPVEHVDSAIEKVRWYARRWNIEVFHKILKSGCAVEKAQLGRADRLKRYAVIKSLVAWRLFWLTRLHEHDPDSPCDQILEPIEWKLLQRKLHKSTHIPSKPPTVREAFIGIARLGGYLNRKSDPDPGIISLWRGWERLSDIVDDYRDICGQS